MMCLIRTGVLSRGLARHLDSHRHDPARVHGAEPGGRGDQDVAAEEPDPAPSADARPQERDYDARPRRPATCWARITQRVTSAARWRLHARSEVEGCQGAK